MPFIPEINIGLSFLTAFVIVITSIPSIVAVAQRKNLFDIPNSRKSHTSIVPTLGGLAIFAGMLIALLLWADVDDVKEFNFIIAGLVIVFFIGLKDDILLIAPNKKLLGQILAAIIIVVLGDLRLTDFHGIFGITQIPYLISVLLSVFVFIVLINGINLIDGIDGLAAGIGIVVSFTFGIWFYVQEQYEYTIVASALAGALISFFIYNVFGTRNKIFMGDTGSLMLGMMMAVFAIKFNEITIRYIPNHSHVYSAPAISVGILIIPLFDTLRVFVLRLANGQSPFKADKNHVHHLLLELGLSHFAATMIIVAVNIGFITFVFSYDHLGTIDLLVLMLAMAMTLTYIPYVIMNFRYKRLIRNGNEKAPAYEEGLPKYQQQTIMQRLLNGNSLKKDTPPSSSKPNLEKAHPVLRHDDDKAQLN
jgi:UDP-GlcNAc:undecaprenyl-phosphate/decaprenyl-phosphate GlcNAc-1-phosphate transferase